MRVFLDANILFSAAKSDGAVRHFLDLLIKGDHQCWVDGHVVEEARRNIAVKAPARLFALESLLRRVSFSHDTLSMASPEVTMWLPQSDRPVLAAAIRIGCDALVTGDRTHFGPGYGKAFGGVTIHSPRSLAEWLGM